MMGDYGEALITVLIGIGFVLLMLAIIPLLGEGVYLIIKHIFGHELNEELYWTGIGLITVAGIVYSFVGRRND